MNFEVIDNCFQILVLWCAALTATGLSIRYRERRFLILALAYACFSMGTLYWVLYLAILGMFPQVFYVAEISWLAAYFFYLSLQVLRSEHLSIHFAPLPALLGCLVAVAAVINNIFGPSPLMLSHTCPCFACSTGCPSGRPTRFCSSASFCRWLCMPSLLFSVITPILTCISQWTLL